jgi:hypothetical protein
LVSLAKAWLREHFGEAVLAEALAYARELVNARRT